MRRRRVLRDFASLAPFAPAWWGVRGYGAEHGDRTVVVLSSSGAPAYREAVEGLRAGLGTGVAQQCFEMSGTEGQMMSRVQTARARLIVAIGSRATAAACNLDAPILAAMIMGSDSGAMSAGVSQKRIISRIPLDVPPRTALARLKHLFPTRRRIGVIWGPSGTRTARAEIASEAAALGMTVRWVECGSPKEMLKAVPGLAGTVDLVWCLPDRALYEPALVQALMLSSIRARLPLVGFSTGLVRAGALAGFQADYRQIGAQAAESALRFLDGARLKAWEEPRVVKTLVNERAVRIFGIDFRSTPGVEDLVLVK